MPLPGNAVVIGHGSQLGRGSLSRWRELALWRAVDCFRTVRLQFGNLLQHALDAVLGVECLDAPGALPFPGRRQCLHPSLLPFEALEVWIVRGRLEAGHVS